MPKVGISRDTSAMAVTSFDFRPSRELLNIFRIFWMLMATEGSRGVKGVRLLNNEIASEGLETLCSTRSKYTATIGHMTIPSCQRKNMS